MSAELLPEILRADVLEARLSKSFPRLAQSGALIGLRIGDDALTLATGRLELAPTGCITKLFTATLVGQLLGSRGSSLDSSLSRLLRASPPLGPGTLQALTVRQLLEHSHGLDDSLSPDLRRLQNGLIDTRILCERLSGPPLASPGYGYSYSDAGGWLLGAILEQHHGRRYSEVLQDQLLAPLGMRSARFDDPESGMTDVCPALGRALRLSASDVLRFVHHHLSSDDPWCLRTAAVSGEVTTLSGWSPLECGVLQAWKYFGSGWYGHNSVLRPTAALLRVNPEARIALFIAATDHSPTAIATTIFGKYLPGIVRLQMPKMLTNAELSEMNTARYLGFYQNAVIRFEIQDGGDGGLEVRAYRRDGSRTTDLPFLHAKLRAARNHIFFAQPSEPRLLPFLQFIEPDGDGYRFLWNGTALWPNVSRCAPTT